MLNVEREKECGCEHEKNKYDYYAPKKKNCKPEYKQKYYNPCYGEDEIIYIEQDDIYMNNGCTTYVSPMYDMCSMQYMGGFAEQYPSLDMPYMNPYINQYPDMNDMWMNYYMMMQNMMQNMMIQPRDFD